MTQSGGEKWPIRRRTSSAKEVIEEQLAELTVLASLDWIPQSTLECNHSVEQEPHGPSDASEEPRDQ